MKTGMALVLAGGLLLGGVAEASQFSDGLGKSWGYLFSPVNAVAQFGNDIGKCVLDSSLRFVQTVISNANPSNLIP